MNGSHLAVARSRAPGRAPRRARGCGLACAFLASPRSGFITRQVNRGNGERANSGPSAASIATAKTSCGSGTASRSSWGSCDASSRRTGCCRRRRHSRRRSPRTPRRPCAAQVDGVPRLLRTGHRGRQAELRRQFPGGVTHDERHERCSPSMRSGTHASTTSTTWSFWPRRRSGRRTRGQGPAPGDPRGRHRVPPWRAPSGSPGAAPYTVWTRPRGASAPASGARLSSEGHTAGTPSGHDQNGPGHARCHRRGSALPAPRCRAGHRGHRSPGPIRDDRAAGLRGRGLPRAPRLRRRRPRRPRPVYPPRPDGRGRVRARRAEGHAVAPAPRLRDCDLHDRRRVRARGFERRRRRDHEQRHACG